MDRKPDGVIQTGRTQRMLGAAIAAAKQGKAVYVVAHSPACAKQLEHRFRSMTGGRTFGVKFETPNSLYNLDLERMELRGAHSHCQVFADHALFESLREQIFARIEELRAQARVFLQHAEEYNLKEQYEYRGTK